MRDTPAFHAPKIVAVTMEADTQITAGPGITITALRTTSRDIRRHKVSGYQPQRQSPGSVDTFR